MFGEKRILLLLSTIYQDLNLFGTTNMVAQHV